MHAVWVPDSRLWELRCKECVCRLKVYGKKTIEDVHRALAELPEGITTAFNLGHADVFPSTSGKENAAKYLMSKFDADPSSSFLLCDDDNDIGALTYLCL